VAGKVREVGLQDRALVALFFTAFLARPGMGPLFWAALPVDSRPVSALDLDTGAVELGAN
jgi:hypothetical protein